MFSVQAARTCGQIRPVNSGSCWWSAAHQRFAQLPAVHRSFQSGMMLLTGHPVVQNGMPQIHAARALSLGLIVIQMHTNSDSS